MTVASLPPQAAGSVRSTSYAQILRSSALIGGASALTLIIGIVRTKALALLLGPAGIGLMGAYTSITDLARSVAEMGISRSGVRQIAESVGTGDERRIARTITVLRRITIVLGVLGAALLAAVSLPVSHLTFGSDQYATEVALLSLAVLFGLVSGGQAALLQGMRRIADLARQSVLGAVGGSLAAIAIVYVWRADGVVAALVATAAITAVLSWWYVRKVRLVAPEFAAGEFRSEAVSLLRLGIAFMVSGLLMMGAAYAVRIIVVRMDGFDAAGFYQAAWVLGGLYIGLVLQAMGSDFYPRLVAQSHDNEACNRLVNEQAQVSLLLAGPGVIATLVLAPFLLSLFYSTAFSQGADCLRWICMGMGLRVATWPVGFIIVAKNRQRSFIAVELAWTIFNVGASWLLVERYGYKGAGIAFFLSYVFHAIILYPLAKSMTGFAWSPDNVKGIASFVALIGVPFLGFILLPPLVASVLGIVLLAVSCVCSIRGLLRLVGDGHLPKIALKLLSPWRPSARQEP